MRLSRKILEKAELDKYNEIVEKYPDVLFMVDTKFEEVDDKGYHTDLFLGTADLEGATMLRVTNYNPDVVFTDDPLRILRVLRFQARYGWSIDDYTWTSMVRNSDRLTTITQERITEEFNKILMSKYFVYGIHQIRACGNALRIILPELGETIGMTQNDFHAYDVWGHTMKTLEGTKEDLVCRVAALLHDIGKIKTRTVGPDGRVHFYNHENIGADLAREILVRMRYPNDFIDEVCFIIKYHMRTKVWKADCSKMKDRSLRRLQYKCRTLDRFENLLDVINADNMAHKPEHNLVGQTDLIMKRTIEMIGDGTAMFGYKPPINGNDIMEIKGIGPGPYVKKYKDWVINRVIDNPKITKEALIKQIKNFNYNEESSIF